MKILFSLLTALFLITACSHKESCKDGSCGKKGEDVKTTDRVPEFDGHCAMGVCLKKERIPCDPKIVTEYKGKAYCFSSDAARDAFLKDIEKNTARAHEQWAESGGGSSRR